MFNSKSLLWSLVAGCILSGSTVQAANVSLSFTVTRPAKPVLYFKYLTLKVNACGATSATVTADNKAVASTVTGGNVVFTTDGNAIVVNLIGTTSTAGLGTFTKAVLKDDKKWAWSHGLDDNYSTDMQSDVNAFKVHGYTGTCYWNGIALSWNPTNTTVAVGAGWTIGNHSWSHEGNDGATVGGSATSTAEVTHNDSALVTAMGAAGVANYVVNTFANPLFDNAFNSVVSSLYTAGKTNIVLLEPNNNLAFKLICDSGATTTGGYSPVSLGTLPVLIGRDFNAFANVNATTDYMHTNSNATHHLWYNSGNDCPTDASGSAATAAVAHVYSSYNAEAWVASSAEVIDYLITAKYSTVTYNPQGSSVVRGLTARPDQLKLESLKVFDLRGKEMASVAASNSNRSAAGVYFVKSGATAAALPQNIVK